MINFSYRVFDTESTKIPRHTPWHPDSYLCSVGAVDNDNADKAWLFNHVSEPCGNHREMVDAIQKEVDQADVIVFHNAKHDLGWFRKMGIKFDNKNIWCTMLAEYLLVGQNPKIPLSLNACAARRGYGQKVDDMHEYWENGYETDEIPWDLHRTYLIQDVSLTRDLFLDQYEQIKKAGLEKVAYLTFELSKILSEVEYYGVEFDAESAKKYVHEYDEKLKVLNKELCDIAGVEFSPSSSDQLYAVMYGGVIKRTVQELVAKPRKNGTFRVYTRKAEYHQHIDGVGFIPHEATKSAKTGKYSTGKKARQLLHYDTDQQELFYKKLEERANAQKVYSTLWSSSNSESGLLRKLGGDRRLHPNFNQSVTCTGRLSSSNPNGQNFPRGTTSPLKKLIIPRYDYIVNADLSQIEWRTAAALSHDPIMCDEIRHGFDVHTDSAQRWFDGAHLDVKSKPFKKIRTTAKIFNFRMLYNGKPKAFYYDGNMPRYSLERWQKIVPGFYEKYKGLRSWQLRNEKIVNKENFLRNPSGRFLTFDYNTDDEKGPLGYNLNDICNYPVQSISADLMFLAMVNIWRKVRSLGLKSRLILQVHDSLVWDCPKEEVYIVSKICADTFERLPELSKEYFGWEIEVPLTSEVAIGRTYGDLYMEYKANEVTKNNIDWFFCIDTYMPKAVVDTLQKICA